MEVVYFVFLCQLIHTFQNFLEQIFKQLEFFWFSIKFRHCRCEGFGLFRDSIFVVVEIGWITVRCQLLKGQQHLVCFNCCRSVITAKMWLTCGAQLLVFSRWSSRGTVGNLILKSCCHVRAHAKLFWTTCHHARVLFYLWVV